MKISVTVKTGAREEHIEEIAPGQYRVSVRERPVAGKANAAIIRAFAAHFGVPRSGIAIKTGYTKKRKIVEIEVSR